MRLTRDELLAAADAAERFPVGRGYSHWFDDRQNPIGPVARDYALDHG